MTTISLKKIILETDLTITGGQTLFSEATDSSSISTGSVIFSGGIGITKKLYVGTDLSITGVITSGTWNASTIGVAYGGTGATSLTANKVLLGNGTSAIQSPSTITYSSNTLDLPKLSATDATDATSSTSGAIVITGGLGVAKNIYTGGGILGLSNASSNTILFNVNGVGSPSIISRSSGTKIVLYDSLSASLTDYAIGIETNNIWFSTSQTGLGFKWYHGTYNSVQLSDTQLYLKQNVQSTSITTGTLRVDGGAGISGNVYTSGNLDLTGSITSATWSGNTIAVNRGGTGTTTSTGSGSVVLSTSPSIFSPSFTDTSANIATFTNTTVSNSGSYIQFLDSLNNCIVGLDSANGPYGNDNTMFLQSNGPIDFRISNALKMSLSPSGNLNFTGSVASTSNSTGILTMVGGIGINNATDAVSSTNGGTITTAGGVAIAKKVFIGTDLKVAGTVGIGMTAPESAIQIRGSRSTTPSTGIHMGLTNTNDYSISISAANDTSLSFINFTYSGTDFRGRIIYDNDPDTMTLSTSGGSIITTGGTFKSNDTTASTSATTGAIISAGGLGVAKDAYLGGDLYVNHSSFSSGRIYLSPQTNGIEVSIIFTQNTSASGNIWVMGSNVSGAGTDTFSLYRGTNIFTFASSGVLNMHRTTVSTSNSTGSMVLAGGIGITNTTEAVSSTNGGTITTAGGVAIAKKLFVGGNGSFSAGINMNTTKITNLDTPVASSDAANKSYVDNLLQGLSTKESVRVATTVSGTLASSFENGDVIDGITMATNDRILIKNQASAIGNGIYIVQASGSPVRSSDFQSGSSASGTYTFVEEGTINSDSGWVCTTDTGSDIVNTNGLSFTQFSGAGQIIAGTGLTKSGNELSVNVSQTQISSIGTIVSGTWNASTIGVAYGGTGATSLNLNAVLLGNGTSAIQSPSTITYSSNTLSLPRLSATNDTDATNSTSGSVIISGGLGVAKKIYAGLGLYSMVENSGIFVDDLTSTSGLGIIKKSGLAPFFGASSANNFSFRVSDLSNVSNVSGGTYTEVASISSTGALSCGTANIGLIVSSSSSVNTITSSVVNNVLKLKNANTLGLTSIQFDDSNNVERMSIGYGNSGVGAPLNRTYFAFANNHINYYASTPIETYSATSKTHELRQIIDNTDTAALVVRKDNDTGDVFTVNTTNSRVLINNVDITPSNGDIRETSFSAANNVSSAANVTGFAFANGSVRSFKAIVSVSIDATADLYAIFDLYAIQKTSSWVMATSYQGDDTGIIFTINSSGQVRYTSTNVSGFVSSIVKFRAFTTTV